MNDNEIADQVRNDRTRHPELDSGSKKIQYLPQISYKILRGSALKTYKEVLGSFIDDGSRISVLGVFKLLHSV